MVVSTSVSSQVIRLVPVERLEQMRRFARRHALEALERQAGGPLSDEQAMALAHEAKRWARERPEERWPRMK